ncbi:MAG: hypothetical protein Q9188_004019 [Gyalolechia gomerana]
MRPLHSFIVPVLSLLFRVVLGVPQGNASSAASRHWSYPKLTLSLVTAPPALLATTEAALLPSSTVAGQSCGGCIIVAQVDGVVWYEGVFLNTAATAVVSVGGGNGSRITRTSINYNEGEFTFNPAAGTAAYGTTPLAVTNVGYDSETVIGGATLTSPTAYNLFTAYTLTSQQQVNGVCVDTSYVRTLPTAFTETLASANGQVTLDLAGEQAFISFIGFSTCQGGGANVGGTVLAQVSNLTSTTTMFYPTVALSGVRTTLAATTNPTSRLPLRTTTISEVLMTLTATLSGSSTITSAPALASANAPEIVIGNTTITPSANPVGLPLGSAKSTVFPEPTGPGASGTGVIVGGGNGTMPYMGDAPAWKTGISLWGSALLVFLMAVGWLL